ncbi:hypothetical protein M422DRAFT_264032 [Sphaerobolus stellatus SS14]|uniref:Uncharacterized protein n=1 Tax=Sphaerobolus stellatus (strain SS14) TaxID=990650 RepID=A0A0C9V8Z4_SPHS4|nr:hypothetical protein M422DRAFT_264032 [Sphaerobolus stellatus SS14]
MYCVIVVHLTVDDDGHGRDEDTGMSGSGLTWRRVVLGGGGGGGGGGGRLEGKDATRRMLRSSHLVLIRRLLTRMDPRRLITSNAPAPPQTKPQHNSMHNVDSDCIPASPSHTALHGVL